VHVGIIVPSLTLTAIVFHTLLADQIYGAELTACDTALSAVLKNRPMMSRASETEVAALMSVRKCPPLWSPFEYHDMMARSLLMTQRS
jgi:hypothetical protein